MNAAELREFQIAFYSNRAARDTLSAADRSRLAALYLDRARDGGRFTDLERAEGMARASLGLREAHNASTFALLASALMAQHRFGEALRAAERADALEPGVPSHRALIGEVALELGAYDRARGIFDSLSREPLSDVATLRLARWFEITGRPDWARRQLLGVLAEWRRIPDVAPAHLAWIQLRLTELAMKDGRLADADSALTAGLRVAPDDYRLLGSAARLSARRGRWRAAIDYGERAVAIAIEPATVGVLADAYAARGDTLRAAQYAHAMRTIALSGPGFPHRAWSLWLLDHNLEVTQVLQRAREELRVRKDVYGYDLYAWALHKSGRHADAWRVMQRALRMGTRDRQLALHGAAIRAALGE